MKLAIVLVATGPHYRHFLNPLTAQIEEFFTAHPKDIFLVSDLPTCPRVHTILPVEHLPPPLPSLLRYHWLCRLRSRLLAYDYLYYLDVDAEIVRFIDDEVLQSLIAVRHWRWPKAEMTVHATFETRTKSRACVDPQTAAGYFHGSFQGGETRRFLRAARLLRDRINEDLTNRGKGRGGTIALWYDESHWNRFVNENFSLFHVLGPEYAAAGPATTECPFIRLRPKDDKRLWSWTEGTD